ncbi:MAG: glycoside hydrolase family 3 N-terminal domain-containing protein, partial [Chloroflexota bacterium]
GHPGGPAIDRLAAEVGADDRAHAFPVSKLGRESLDFSFSGLKTALLYAARGVPGQKDDAGDVIPLRDAAGLDHAAKRDLAASFQRAACAAVVLKLERALERVRADGACETLLVGGGVTANSRLRRELVAFGDSHGLEVRLPAMDYCVDNAAMIAGLQGAGIIAAAKHFPGHGDTVADSHHAAPTVHHSRERVRAVELAPFAAAIGAGVGAVMPSHIVYTALDDANPATLSAPIIKGLLREEMGFTGLTITDAMDMHAVSRFGGPVAVERALAAGNDLVLMGHLPGQIEMMTQFAGMVQPDALARIAKAQATLSTTIPELSVIGSTAHRAVAQEIADASITVVRHDETLPLAPAPEATIAVITTHPADLTPADTSSTAQNNLAAAVHARHANTVHVEIPHEPSETDVTRALDAVTGAAVVIVGTVRAEVFSGQAALVEALELRGQSPVVVALRTPYDIAAFPYIRNYLCAYGSRDCTTEAVARVLFGEIEARGVLPCGVPGLPETV